MLYSSRKGQTSFSSTESNIYLFGWLIAYPYAIVKQQKKHIVRTKKNKLDVTVVLALRGSLLTFLKVCSPFFPRRKKCHSHILRAHAQKATYGANHLKLLLFFSFHCYFQSKLNYISMPSNLNCTLLEPQEPHLNVKVYSSSFVSLPTSCDTLRRQSRRCYWFLAISELLPGGCSSQSGVPKMTASPSFVWIRAAAYWPLTIRHGSQEYGALCTWHL